MKVICDKCKHEFIVEPLTEKIQGDIQRVYFICPKCNEKYISYYLNSKIIQKQLKAKKLLQKMESQYLGTNKYNKYFKEYQELTKEIKQDMQNLKKRF